MLNVFRMFSKMSGDRLAVKSDGMVPLSEMLRQGTRRKPDVGGLASLDGKKLCLMTWHYDDDDVPGPTADVKVEIKGLGQQNGEATVVHYRIDEEHSNAYALWKRMGSLQNLTDAQYEKLEQAGQLATVGKPQKLSIEEGKTSLRFALPRQAVSLFVLTWK